ncbi:NADP-dependent oxidoreductase domain-containing protein 1 [Eublepharis macularius]|uniref:NADP-dependent oxidoreductase domain-containing protein 1 n=1 Tax=Eublepharis macularius TaxID=481883 RepID=A0AA97IYW2_EUBMA|nr:NADP-dependent oxidoreductase domain-containing protein 1 [Eublepharis macularius]XP_054828086.1 NADP-dependent oxidoreductase domain-containing protein 1 [Eublepharis macularius]
MADLMQNLKTFQPDYGIDATEERLLHLRNYAKGLTVNACAHAVFFCELLEATKQKPEIHEDVPLYAQEFKEENLRSLRIGIIGGGHIGKQLARVFLELSGFPGKNIQISTRRPETLLEFQALGVQCFYNNRQLVGWADVVFLCCLPSHLPNICSEVYKELNQSSIIYSLVTATPLPRLQQLLSSSAILRPHYKFTDGSLPTLWEGSRTVVEALKDTAVVQATCPLGPLGVIAIEPKWLEAVFYAALNSYTCQDVPYTEALKLLNEVCFPEDVTSSEEKKSPPEPLFVCESFINEAFASSLAPDDTFPWFDLTTVQLKESPLNQLLATSTSLQNKVTSLYYNVFALLAAVNKESMSATSKKIPLSAVLLHPTTNQELTMFGTYGTCTSNAEGASSSESEDLN